MRRICKGLSSITELADVLKNLCARGPLLSEDKESPMPGWPVFGHSIPTAVLSSSKSNLKPRSGMDATVAKISAF
jgi:hypothetical protein